MAEAAKNPVGQQQKIIVPNKHGEKLVGLLHETSSADLVILCHGFRATKENSIMVNLAVALENEGISSFRFDFAGNGESEGTIQHASFRREADDLHSVVEYFSGVKRAPSAIIGHSRGGDAVLLYASIYHDICTVVNVSGRYDLKRGIEEHYGKDFMEVIKKEGFIDVKNKSGDGNYRVTKESLMDRLSTDMHESCLKIDKECRVVTIHGTTDEINPVEDALEFAKIIPNHKLHLIEGANHLYTSHQAKLASVVVDFIKAALQQDKATSN
ncbi:uncharacterized protein LOC108865373 isoform X1 [Pyrus x bretschneideri]|uniref:uncharacterized protein LOC108865373 isoform X1 n=3 Tax=Pyrus x bretschneideri TaxID=225117 RepID=UPI00203041D0|nr:uncharacterized protein LOC108865373 isoform X1 [Pyrus x bretschneideri]